MKRRTRVNSSKIIPLKTVGITLPENLVEKARKYGLNISFLTRKALIQEINRIENQNNKTNPKQRELEPPPGFEPGIFSLQGKGVDWGRFELWLLRDHKRRVARSMLSYARKFSHCLLEGDLSEVVRLRETLRPNVLKALSALSKYLGVYQQYKVMLRSYGLRWRSRSSDDLIIGRLTRVRDPDEVFTWIRRVKVLRPDLSDFMDFIAVTGLRLGEAVESYNLIIRLAGEGKLEQYYSEDRSVLEHFRFKELFIRRGKKAFVSFVPKEIVEAVSKNRPIASFDAIHSRLKKKKMRLRFSDVREAHACFLTKYLTPPEIDFLHGRVSASVFMKHYFNPALISDLAQRTLKAIEEILTKIN